MKQLFFIIILVLLSTAFFSQKQISGKTPLPEMVKIQGGTFSMGSNDGRSNEKPVHSVTVSTFYMGKYEVTFEEYDKFCDATGRSKPDDEGWGRGNRPVINVSWNDATSYCNWLSEQTGETYRLPTEAEWEYAARGGNSYQEWAGTNSESSLYQYANFCDTKCNFSWKDESQKDGYKHTAPVGTYKPNGYGLYDMSGNVWEWCGDWYASDYYKNSPQNNPVNTQKNSYRVVRGGSWYDYPKVCRVANRGSSYPTYSGYYNGFRVARCQ